MPHRDDERQIRALISDWAQAVRAQDLNGATAHHTDDVVMFDAPMPVQSRGLESYRKTWIQFFAQSPGGPGSFDITELQIAAGDPVSYCHAIVNIRDSQVRLTIGMRKENEHWQFAHEHHSYPIQLPSE
jgi:uncharacterized protein (TIGR02246 family)